MSLVGIRIGGRTTTQSLATSSRPLAAPSFIQIRGIKRRENPNKNQSKGGYQDGQYEDQGQKMKQSGAAFKALPPNQLKEPIFHQDSRATLALPGFTPKAVTAQTVGTAMEFVKTDIDRLRAYGVPRNLLVDFRMLSKPCTVVRDVTLSLISRLRNASQDNSEISRLVLTGPRGCGKSVVLLQAVEHCAANGWIVLYIPRGISLVNSSTQYIYDPRTRTYLQPDFTYEVLRRFVQVNRKALESMKSTKEFVYDKTTLRVGTSLLQLAQVSIEGDKVSAPTVLEALLAELGLQKKHPVLFAVDDIQALYSPTSQYRDPRFQSIKPWHLSLPRLILEYASGHRQFQRGAVLGALSCSDTRFGTPLELAESLNIPYNGPSSPYVRRKQELVQYAKGLKNIPVPAQLQVDEAASIFEVWMQDKALSAPLTDETFMATYTQTSGNAREFVWRGLLGSFTL